MLLCFFLACLPPKTTSVEEPAPVEIPPSSNSLTLQEQLKGYEATPCAELQFSTQEPWLELEALLDIPRPPWIAMRSATCMLTYPQQSHTYFIEWLTSPNLKGLAIMLCSSFEQLPKEQQFLLVDIAFSGPHVTQCALRLKNYSIVEIREKAQKYLP